MKGKTKLAIILVTILLVVAVVIRLATSIFFARDKAPFGREASRKGGETEANILDVTVVGTKVRVGDIEKYISLSGEIRGIEEASALPDVPGKVERILVSEGMYVSKNQHLMYIDRSQVGFSYNPSPVRAPISGRVGSINVSEGQFVSQTTPVATIINDSVVEVILFLPEAYIRKVKKGNIAAIEVTPYPEEKFIGHIHSIDTMIDRGTRTLKVRVRANNPQRKLISGMYCTVRLLVEKVTNTTYVPNTAIRNINNEEVVYILTRTNMNPRGDNLFLVSRRKVTSKLSDGKFTAVEGVNEGEMVVSLGAEYLRDGVIVRVIEE